ncbi:hypothetical protein [Bradyrhizobium australafricanum]|uniref:hypothetical protein n=1 Tax=Bradyrhizobium australafricanum TaxID=2821406 RepID=UPI001CE3AAB5|nr:hypothetical protein [Bradyrhizobium australafricanum]MCA6100733.1 hypothetical protein [Bradyrhizobium australafricanum]
MKKPVRVQRGPRCDRAQGSTGWMVYDSELKGPTQIKKDGHFAEKLTKEHAEIVAKGLRNRIRAAEVGAGRQHSQCVKAALNAR